MSYWLDGIKTAMVERDNAKYGTHIICGCGTIFAVRPDDPWSGVSLEVKRALRFHYTHCPNAKLNEADP